MAAGILDLYIEQGASFSRLLTIESAPGVPIDITGAHTWSNKRSTHGHGNKYRSADTNEPGHKPESRTHSHRNHYAIADTWHANTHKRGRERSLDRYRTGNDSTGRRIDCHGSQPGAQCNRHCHTRADTDKSSAYGQSRAISRRNRNDRADNRTTSNRTEPRTCGHGHKCRGAGTVGSGSFHDRFRNRNRWRVC